MKTNDTLVQEYLAAVERESTALPQAARQELIADLSEHIEVARAERPGEVRTILREVGDPRMIASTALHELGHPGEPQPPTSRRRRSPAWLPLVLLTISAVLPYAGDLVLLNWIGLVMKVTAVVMVCRSRHWTAARKWIGLTLTTLLPAIISTTWYLAFVAPGNASVIDTWRWPLVAVSLVLTLGGAGWLWRTRRP
ncbi:hypothetical protein ACFV97_17295 [Streptomyces sp. NPDC059913]|uniref:HAAS signaling domain-containing protein n=1 Tax=unclassified Streptomyces TaxID=2593676 RepID=UPI003665B7F9